MFEHSADDPTLVVIARLSRTLTTLDADADDSVRVDRIRALEQLRSVLAAAQARETAAFVDSQRAAQRAAGVPADRVGCGVAAQVALARRISPFHGGRYVGWVKILTTELPCTYAALAAGQVPEARALLVARETVWLSREHRAQVDRQLAPRLESLSDRRVEAECKKLAYALDPDGYVVRLRQVDSERRVSLRPAPDCMTRLTALLPVAQGVAACAALGKAADTARAAGDVRGRGQVMADTLVERVTGQTTAEQVPVEINLIMTDESLFTTGVGYDEPAVVLADGVAPVTVPADLARRAATSEAAVFLRRLYTSPETGRLVSMDSRRRLFPNLLRRFLIVRDQYCRTPWCGAPIRHADHIVPVEEGGPTSAEQGQGLCEACNYAKQAGGWTQHVDRDQIITNTPTGHRYRSSPPRPPGRREPSRLEYTFRHLITAA